jgi:PAS domain S-box-containing protein
VTTWNPGAEAIKGYSADEILGKHFSLFYTPEDRACGEPEREIAAATSGAYEAEGWRLRKNGERFWASVAVSPLFHPDGGLRGFAKITRDLTEQRRAYEERIRLERAEETLRVRDQFLDEAKRNLNSILTTIRIHVHSLKSTVDGVGGETPPGLQAKLTTLEWGLDRLARRIEDALQTIGETADRLVRQHRK